MAAKATRGKRRRHSDSPARGEKPRPDLPTRVTTVLIIDDHPIVRHGLRKLLEEEPDLAVCDEAGTYADALAAIERNKPDVVMVDLALGSSSGVDLIQDLVTRNADLRILAVSVHDEQVWAPRALHAGAHGYVMKQAEPATLLAAVRRVAAGDVYVSEVLGRRLLRRLIRPGGEPSDALTIESLTDRELEVLQLLGRGLSSRQIASQLGLSVKTVETYRVRIKRKLRLRTSSELLQHAIAWSNNHPP